MKCVQCYELFGGIALKIHTFSFMLLYLFLFFSVLFQNIALCAAFFLILSPTLHSSNMYVLCFSYLLCPIHHITSHALMIASLEYHHNFGIPTSINSIIFHSNRFLFSSFSNLIFLSICVFGSIFLIFLSVSAITSA